MTETDLDQRRAELPVGPLPCVIDGPTRGRAWSASAVRTELHHLALKTGVRRRFARISCVMPTPLSCARCAPAPLRTPDRDASSGRALSLVLDQGAGGRPEAGQTRPDARPPVTVELSP
jgi:hypothetical protein